MDQLQHTTVKFSVLTNGAAEGFLFFCSSKENWTRGLPIPFLIHSCHGGSQNYDKDTTKINGWISGFEVATNSAENMEVTHLQYADDTLIFCDADEEQLKVFKSNSGAF